MCVCVGEYWECMGLCEDVVFIGFMVSYVVACISFFV